MQTNKPNKNTTKKDSNKEKDHSSDGEFEVENILAKRIFKGKIEYKIKWRYYSIKESTWEPAENLGGAKQIVEKFEKKLLNRKLSRHKSMQNTQNDKNKIKDIHKSKTVNQKEELKNKEYIHVNEKENDNTQKQTIKDGGVPNDKSVISELIVKKKESILNNEMKEIKNNINVEIIEICDVFVCGRDLFAKVLCKMNSNIGIVVKTKIVTTKELGNIAPELLLKYYLGKANHIN